MKITETLKLAWEQFSQKQKFIVVGAGLIIFILMTSGWIDSLAAQIELRKLKTEVRVAKQEAAEAIQRAAKIAKSISEYEEKLRNVEGKRDEKQIEVNKAKQNTGRLRDDYERVIRESRPNVPSTEQLCRELSELGYPCQ